MMQTVRPYKTERLVDLERTVDFINGQLREMQWKLYRPKAEPLSVRLWRNLVSLKGRQEFMSDVCNRRVRPNTKMVSYVGPRL
ncbi:MAG: hypothetical protein NTX84_08755 [Nitrospirae bacterium]|nr:hypothetical protein [Nitrospirota bacterium]